MDQFVDHLLGLLEITRSHLILGLIALKLTSLEKLNFL